MVKALHQHHFSWVTLITLHGSLPLDSPAAYDGDGNQGDDEDHRCRCRPSDQGQLLPQLRLEVVCMEQKAKRQTLWMPLRWRSCLYFEILWKKEAEARSDGLTDKAKTAPLWAVSAESPRASVCLTDRPHLINQETESKWWWVCWSSQVKVDRIKEIKKQKQWEHLEMLLPGTRNE